MEFLEESLEAGIGHRLLTVLSLHKEALELFFLLRHGLLKILIHLVLVNFLRPLWLRFLRWVFRHMLLLFALFFLCLLLLAFTLFVPDLSDLFRSLLRFGLDLILNLSLVTCRYGRSVRVNQKDFLLARGIFVRV